MTTLATLTTVKTTQTVQNLSDESKALLKEIIALVRVEKNKTQSSNACNIYKLDVTIPRTRFKGLVNDCKENNMRVFIMDSGLVAQWVNNLGRMDSINITLKKSDILDPTYAVIYKQGKITID